MTFLDIGFIDILDIFLVAYLFYTLYRLLKGTVAINIFAGILTVWAIWWIVKALDMQLLGTILGQFISLGVLALIIVFQQEIRRFFLLIGSEYFDNINLSLENIFSRFIKKEEISVKVTPIAKACMNMSKKNTGALIVISDKTFLEAYAREGTVLNAETTTALLETIFFKNSPLHDGAVFIIKDKIYAAGCVLPVSESHNKLPQEYGLRHRAALGISEATSAFVITVSEETGKISYFKNGKFFPVIMGNLREIMEKEFKKEDEPEKEKKKKRKIKLSPFIN